MERSTSPSSSNSNAFAIRAENTVPGARSSRVTAATSARWAINGCHEPLSYLAQ